MVFAMSYVPMMYLATGRIQKRYGSGHPSIVSYQAFKCKDGKYLITARVKNRDVLIPILEN